jgi:hypothetical protein
MLMWFRVPLLALFETFLSRRTLGHILVGAAAVMVSSVALILVIAFSEGVDRYSAHSYQRSRAIIGSLRVQPRGVGRFTLKQVDELERRVGNGGYRVKLLGPSDDGNIPKDIRRTVILSQSGGILRFRIFDANGIVEVDQLATDFPDAPRITPLLKELEPLWPGSPPATSTPPELSAEQSSRLANEVREIVGLKLDGLVPQVSWVSMPSGNDPEVRTNRHQSFPALLRQELYAGSVDAASPIFQEAYGFRLLYGDPLSDHPEGKLQLGVLINTTFLAKYVNRSDEEMLLIRSGRGEHLVPKFLYFNFPAIDGTPQAFEPGSVEVRVVGLCDMDDDQNFPHLFLTEDQGQAYFYLGERWHASYTTQFQQYGKNKPIADPPGDFRAREFKTLPSKDRLEKREGLTGGGFTHYQRAYLHVADDRLQAPGFRAEVKAALQQEKALGVVTNGEIGKEIRKSLDELTIPSPLRRLMEEWEAKVSSGQPGSDPDFELPPKGQGTVDPDKAGNRWTITDTRLYDKWLVRDENGELVVSKMSPFEVVIPSDTVTSTLNRIRFVVNTYAAVIQVTVLILTMLSTILFGFAHYFRKRKDLGLMKASGMSPLTLGTAFSCQVLLVGLVGFAAGMGIGFVASHLLEPVAAQMINKMANAGEGVADTVKFLEISWRVALQTGALILASALLGCIIPATRAAMVRPIEDLNTGI